MIMCLSLFVSTGCMAISQKPSVPPASSSQSFGLEDIDYQIKITKQAMEQYKNQAFLLNEKAQSIMDRDFEGYRHAEMLSQQAQAIANDLANRLQQLEEQRAQMVKEQGQKAPAKQ